MILIYVVAGIAITLMTLIMRSQKVMNYLTILYATIFTGLTAYALVYLTLPAYYLKSRFFFMDYLNLYEIMIASFIFLLASIYSGGYIDNLFKIGEMSKNNIKLFYVIFQMLLLAVTLAFFSNNLALFWIFLELTTLFSAILIITTRSQTNIIAALNYVFIASASMLFSFVGIILIFAISKQVIGAGSVNWDILMQNAPLLPPKIFAAAFIFLMIGFASKSGIVPFHTWLPFAYSRALSPASVVMAAGVSNLGLYGILRVYAVISKTEAVNTISTILILFGILSIAIAAFSMLPRTNMKKLIAFSSVEHMGVMLLGIGIGTPIAIFWVLFHFLAHSLTKALLFFSAGIMHNQYGTTISTRMKNALILQPLASLGLIIGSAAIIGTPLFPIFLSKIMILVQLGKISLVLLFVVALLFLIISAAFAVFFIRLFTQIDPENTPKRYLTTTSMKIPIILLIIIIFVLGVYFPEGIKSTFETIIKNLKI